MNIITSIIKQDLKLAFRKGGGVGGMLAFYLIVSTLFVFGVGSGPEGTVLIAPAVIWVCALLVQSISVGRIFSDDFEDGTLEQLLLQGELPEKIILARMISNWLTGGFLIVLFSPVIAVMFGLEWVFIQKMFISLVCGTPLLSIISVAIGAVTLGIRTGGAIFGILAFPLYIPVLIFGVSWASDLESFNNNMLMLAAIFVLMLPLCVVSSVAAIKVAFEDG